MGTATPACSKRVQTCPHHIVAWITMRCKKYSAKPACMRMPTHRTTQMATADKPAPWDGHHLCCNATYTVKLLQRQCISPKPHTVGLVCDRPSTWIPQRTQNASAHNNQTPCTNRALRSIQVKTLSGHLHHSMCSAHAMCLGRPRLGPPS